MQLPTPAETLKRIAHSHGPDADRARIAAEFARQAFAEAVERVVQEAKERREDPEESLIDVASEGLDGSWDFQCLPWRAEVLILGSSATDDEEDDWDLERRVTERVREAVIERVWREASDV